MPNTFEQQARERLGRSLAFMAKAQDLLGDDLLYRSALADAVSAIKNMLQGYLLLRIAATPPSGVTQAWQEVANTNRMPELIAACTEAGLDMRGLAPEIKRLNAERNYRTHEDPARLVDAAQADHALKVARDVQRRIRDAVQGRGVARGAAVARAVEGAHAVSGQLRMGAQAAAARAAKSPSPDEVFGDTAAFASRADPLPAHAAAGTVHGASANGHAGTGAGASPTATKLSPDGRQEDDDAEDAGDTGEMSALAPPRRRGRLRRVLLRSVAAAVLLAVGLAGGLFLGAPIAAGRAPDWLAALPGASVPAMPTAKTAQATPTATTAAAIAGATALGTLAIAAPVCAAGRATFALTNSGTQPLAYSAAGASAGMTIATTPAGTGQSAVFGTLGPGASQTLHISGAGENGLVVVTAPAGMLQLLVPPC